MDAALHKLASFGHARVSWEWLGAGMRLHRIGAYAVYVRVTETDTIVPRLLHGRMDVSATLFEPPAT